MAMQGDTRKIEEPRAGRLPRRVTEVYCCGAWLDCRDFTNTCDCGADYNFSGARLAPRSQWGEETGESWQDCY